MTRRLVAAAAALAAASWVAVKATGPWPNARHSLTCWLRCRWRRRYYHQPFWRDDKTAQMLGVAHKGCPRCGRGAVRRG